jgi:hypothetical protein
VPRTHAAHYTCCAVRGCAPCVVDSECLVPERVKSRAGTWIVGSRVPRPPGWSRRKQQTRAPVIRKRHGNIGNRWIERERHGFLRCTGDGTLDPEFLLRRRLYRSSAPRGSHGPNSPRGIAAPIFLLRGAWPAPDGRGRPAPPRRGRAAPSEFQGPRGRGGRIGALSRSVGGGWPRTGPPRPPRRRLSRDKCFWRRGRVGLSPPQRAQSARWGPRLSADRTRRRSGGDQSVESESPMVF